MGMRNTLDQKNKKCDAPPVIDKMLGTAYETVLSLVEKLPVITYLEKNIDGFVSDIHSALDATLAAEQNVIAQAVAALASQNAAAASEAAARASELAAAQSEAAAQASEVAAAASQASAISEAAAALASEQAALLSETHAAASEVAAHDSEVAAAASAAAALASQDAAALSETHAATSRDTAGVSATAAQTAQAAAEAARDIAVASKEAAAVSEGRALVSETNARTSETNAKESETISSVSATAASTSAQAAANAVVTVQGILHTMNELYLGNHATDPTVDNNGGPLAVGAEYFNTVTNEKRVFTSTGWQDVDYTAETMAANATASASQAAGSAAAAADSATTATTQAGIATTKADAAKQSANDAALSAGSALGAYQATVNARDTAAGSATSASDSAAAAAASATQAANSAATAAAAAPVKSVAGRTGDVLLSVTDVSGAAPADSPTFTGNPTTNRTAVANRSGLLYKSLGSTCFELGLTKDAAANFRLDRFDDTGVYQDSPVVVSRSAGALTLNGSVTLNGNGQKTPGAARLTLNAKAAAAAALVGSFAGSPRWNISMPDTDGHLRVYRNPTGSADIVALALNLSTGALGTVSITADTTIQATGYMTANNGFVSYANAGSGRAGFTQSGDNGQGWNDWTGTGQPALQMDMANFNAAYTLARCTRWGGKHVAAIQAYEGTSAYDWRLSFAVSSSNQFVFNSLGQGLATGGWATASDARLKTNRVVIADAGEKLDTLTGETWTRIDIQHDNARRYAGVIAQAVQAVLPEAVSENDGTLNVEIAGVVGLLVEALKETRQELRELKARVQTLETT